MTKLCTSINLCAAAACATAIAACGASQQSTTPPPGQPPETAKAKPATPPTTPPEAVKKPPAAPVKPPVVARAQPPVQNLVFPDEPFRNKQPKAGERHTFRLPRLKRVNLRRGIHGYLMEDHSLPTISVSLVIPGGSINDPKGKEGLAGVCMDLLTSGTKKLDRLAFSAALADTASRVNSYAGRDEQVVTMATLSKYFDATFALFRDSLLNPGFRADELGRIIKRRVARLRQARASAASVSRRLSRAIAMGKNHPLARITTMQSLNNINVNDCVAYHKRWIKPRLAKLFVVGDMTRAQLRKKFGKGLVAWKGRAPRSARVGNPKPMPGRVFFVDIPGSAQSSVVILNRGPRRKARNYFANSMAVAVLGGSFSARVNMNLREDKGYSYGARAGFVYNRKFGRFYAGAQVRSDSTYQSVLELIKEIKAISSGKKPATRAELTRERNGDILGLPGRFATARSALARYRGLIYYGLPLGYYNSYARKLSRLTLAQVNRAAHRVLGLKGARLLVVGDGDAMVKVRKDGKDVPLMVNGKPVKLRDSLQMLVASGKLGKGKLVTLDVDGNTATAGTATSSNQP